MVANVHFVVQFHIGSAQTIGYVHSSLDICRLYLHYRYLDIYLAISFLFNWMERSALSADSNLMNRAKVKPQPVTVHCRPLSLAALVTSVNMSLDPGS